MGKIHASEQSRHATQFVVSPNIQSQQQCKLQAATRRRASGSFIGSNHGRGAEATRCHSANRLTQELGLKETLRCLFHMLVSLFSWWTGFRLGIARWLSACEGAWNRLISSSLHPDRSTAGINHAAKGPMQYTIQLKHRISEQLFLPKSMEQPVGVFAPVSFSRALAVRLLPAPSVPEVAPVFVATAPVLCTCTHPYGRLALVVDAIQ